MSFNIEMQPGKKTMDNGQTPWVWWWQVMQGARRCAIGWKWKKEDAYQEALDGLRWAKQQEVQTHESGEGPEEDHDVD